MGEIHPADSAATHCLLRGSDTKTGGAAWQRSVRTRKGFSATTLWVLSLPAFWSFGLLPIGFPIRVRTSVHSSGTLSPIGPAWWSWYLPRNIFMKRVLRKAVAQKGKLPPALEKLRDHSLTIFLLITGIIWIAVYVRADSESKWGQVVGNIVSEWTQIAGLVLLTKHFIEYHSKESER